MNSTFEIELNVRVRLSVRVMQSAGDEDAVAINQLMGQLPISPALLSHVVNVQEPAEAVVRPCAALPNMELGSYRVLLKKEFPKDGELSEAEFIVRGRQAAFDVIKQVEQERQFTCVEVFNAQGGVDARMLTPTAGYSVVNTATGQVLATRMALPEARRLFATNLATQDSPLALIDHRGREPVEIARSR